MTAHTPEAKSDAVIAAISRIKPRIIFVGDRKNDEVNFRHWEAYSLFLSSKEFNAVPGRYVRMLIIDENSGRGNVLGFAAIASDVNSLGDRDRFIGCPLPENRGAVFGGGFS